MPDVVYPLGVGDDDGMAGFAMGMGSLVDRTLSVTLIRLIRTWSATSDPTSTGCSGTVAPSSISSLITTSNSRKLLFGPPGIADQARYAAGWGHPVATSALLQGVVVVVSVALERALHAVMRRALDARGIRRAGEV